MTRNRRTIIVQEETGYDLNPGHSYFALVTPEDGVNLVTNPECYDTYSYTALSATVAATTAAQRRGAKSLYVQPSAPGGGVYCTVSSLATNTHYTFSVDVRSTVGDTISIHFGDANGNRLGGETVFHAPTFWLRREVSLFTGDMDVRTLVVRSMGDVNFYADGFQLEDKPYVTTFISGNIEAAPDLAAPGRLHYGWMGPPHRSSSFRTRFAGSGGRPIPLHELGLKVTEFSGFGYAAPEVITASLALRSDRVYRGAFALERQFTIGGYIEGDTLHEVLRKRGALGYQAYGTEAEPSPVTLQVQFRNEHLPLHELAEIECVYLGGLEGNINNLHQEKATVTFKALRPFLRLDGNRGQALATNTLSHTSPVTVIYEDGTVGSPPDGGLTWNDDDLPMRMTVGIDGLLYMCAGNMLYKFTRSSCTPLAATEIQNGKIKDLVSGPDGWIHYVYEDSDDGSPTGGINSYDPRTGNVINFGNGNPRVEFATNGIDLELWRIRYDPKYNYLYVCGNFGAVSSGGVWLSSGGVEPAGIIRMDLNYGIWSGFPEISSVPYDTRPYTVRDCAPSPLGLWIVGEFFSPGGPNTWARYHETSGQWTMGDYDLSPAELMGAGGSTPLGNPSKLGPYCCVYEPRYGRLYVGGHFNNYMYTDVGTGQLATFYTGDGICSIDGVSGAIGRVGYGVRQRSPYYIPFVNDLALSPDGKRIFAAGQFSEVASTSSSLPDPPAGSISHLAAPGFCAINADTDEWELLSVTMPGMALPHTISVVPYADSVIAPSPRRASNAYSSLLTPEYTQWYGDMVSANITNNRGAVYVSHSDFGPTYTSPVTTVNISRGARALARLEVTGPCVLKRIVNATSGAEMTPSLTVNAGETVIFSFAPGPVWLRSTTRDIAYPNLGKDSWPDLHFVAGANNILLDISGSGSASLYWREEYAAVEALIA